MRKQRTFGFMCPQFFLGLSADGFVLPKSGSELLRRALLPNVPTANVTGRYTLRVHVDGGAFCKLPVVAAWASHPSLDDSFLVVKVPDPGGLRRHLALIFGKDVELEFIPRLLPMQAWKVLGIPSLA